MDTPDETLDAPDQTPAASIETLAVSDETLAAPADTLDALDPGDDTERGARPPGYGRHSEPEQGTQMGRYVVLRRLGAGGMGTVYLGYDPELDRKVALKLLHGEQSERKRRALLREAQALARLREANVVAVHDVGEHQGHVYVAMEFVEGRTLKQWMAAGGRSWREVLEVFLLAGRGLRAAHEHGLIHRDFKPDNVMVSDEGRVLVMDFGLARPSEEASEEDVDVSGMRVAALTATTVGRLSGTPAYMAPEQMGLEELSPAADQFSYCVSLWEALCGERPFEGDTMAAIYTSVSEGRVRAPARAMPRWLQRALQRGLRPKPEERWASMADLLDAFERGRRRWVWQVGLAAVVAGIGVAGVFVVRQQQREQEHRARVEACEAEGAAIDEVWNDEERARLRAGLLATGVHFAEDSADTVIPWLDDYRDAWSSGRAEACMHRSVRNDWDAELLDRSTWCFEDRRLQLESTVEQIATLNRAGARRAVRIASYLDPVATCLEPKPLRRLPAPPVELRDEIRAVRALLTESDSLSYSGRKDEALKVAQRALVRAEALDWPPLRALARLIVGRRRSSTGNHGQSFLDLTEAYFEAQDAGSLEIAFRAARSLISTLSSLAYYQDAEIWARHARVLAPQLSDPSGLDEAEEHYLLAHAYYGLGDHDAAIRESELAVSMRADVLGPDHPLTAASMQTLGIVLLAKGRAAEALKNFTHSLKAWESTVGHEHPKITDLTGYRAQALLELQRVDEAIEAQKESLAVHEAIGNDEHPNFMLARFTLGKMLTRSGELDEAERMLRRVMVHYESTTGPDSPTAASVLTSLAGVALARGHHDEALERHRRAVEILEAKRGPEHSTTLNALEQVAKVLAAKGATDDAMQQQREVVARRESALGPDHTQSLYSLRILGHMQMEANDLEGARRTLEQALATGEKALGADHSSVAANLAALAEVALAKEEPIEALRLAERAMGIVDAGSAGLLHAAYVRFTYARVLVANGDSEGRAKALAEAARQTFALAYDDRRHEVEAWLAREASE